MRYINKKMAKIKNIKAAIVPEWLVKVIIAIILLVVGVGVIYILIGKGGGAFELIKDWLLGG